MKNKIYFLSLLGCFAMTLATAQCSVTITSLVATGMQVTAHADGNGNMNPGYAWFWDDSSMTTYGSTSYHTYTMSRGYQVCVTYTDSINPFNCVSNDCDSIYIFPASGITDNTEVKAEIKTGPNPFTASTHISLTLNKTSNVEISVFDITGKEVEKIHSGVMDPGIHIFTWKPETLSDGIYFLNVKTGNTIQTRKIIRISGE